jgi:hypothetical protein
MHTTSEKDWLTDWLTDYMEQNPPWETKSLSSSRYSPSFIKTECSLQCPKDHANGPYSKTDESSQYHKILCL